MLREVLRLTNGKLNDIHTRKTEIDKEVERLMNLPLFPTTLEYRNKSVCEELINEIYEVARLDKNKKRIEDTGVEKTLL